MAKRPKPKSAERPAPKRTRRKRDFKAEYRRRLERAEKQGKTRQQARGHKAKEHIERARRSKSKFGASPATMTRLRKQAYERVSSVLGARPRKPYVDGVAKKGLRLLHADDLRQLIDMDPFAIMSAAKVQKLELDQLAEYFPKSIDEIDAAEFNPLWYHR